MHVGLGTEPTQLVGVDPSGIEMVGVDPSGFEMRCTRLSQD